MNLRTAFEDKVLATPSKMSCWTDYINFEASKGEKLRASALYRRAMSKSITAQTDVSFWLKYVKFLYTQMAAEQGKTTARILFETKMGDKDSQFLSNGDKIDILLENARFEEITNNSLKARRIHEQLSTEIAPGLVKATLERINFEKRERNFDRAKELFFSAF